MTTILVVDDEPAIVETIAELLTWEGHSVVTATDGRRALEALAAGPLPDLVIMDFMMPVKDGIQALRIIRGSAALAALRVILTTAAPLSIPQDAPRYDALLVKPFSAQALRTTIAQVLGPTAAR